MSNKHKYLAKNTALFAISSFGTKLFSFFLVPLYTNYLSTTDYGTVDLIQTTATLLIYIFTLNIVDGVFIYVIDSKSDSKGILKYGLQIVLAGSFILGCGLFVAYSLKIVNWNAYCYVFLELIFLFSAINDVFSKYLRAIDKIPVVVLASIAQVVTMLVSSIVCITILKLSIWGYLFSISFGLSVSIIICYCQSGYSLFHAKAYAIEKELKKRIIKYSVPLIFNGVAWWINSSIDKYLITGMLGLDQNGIYSVASKLATILSVFLTIFMSAWNLSAIKEFDSKDNDYFFSNTYNSLNSFLVIIASLLILINIPLSSFLFAKDFFVAWKCSSILLLSGVFSGLSGFVGSIFSATKRSSIFAVSTIIAAIVNLSFNWLLIQYFGIEGAAISTALSFLVTYIIRYLCSKKYIDWHINFLRFSISYTLLCIQIIFEHLPTHFYFGQIMVVLILFIINFSPFKQTIFAILKSNTVGVIIIEKSKKMTKQLIKSILHRFLSVIPLKKGRWVFGAWQGKMFADNSKYMFEYISLNHPDIDAIWISQNEDVVKELCLAGYKCYKPFSFRGIISTITAEVAFETEGNWDISFLVNPSKTKVIQLWHGVAPKKANWSSFDVKNWDNQYWMVSSEKNKCTMHEIIGMPDNHSFVTGYPRNDCAVTNTSQSDVIRLLDKNYPNHKKIMYMPTHRGFGSKGQQISFDDLERIDKILNENKIVMVFKPHFHELKNYIAIEDELTNIILAKDQSLYSDVYSYIFDFDMLISDYSSIIYDFTCCHKPIVLFPYDLEQFRDTDAGLFDYYESIPAGPLCFTWDEVIDNVLSLLNEDNWLEKRELCRKIFHPFDDGRNCERVYDTVMQLLN